MIIAWAIAAAVAAAAAVNNTERNGRSVFYNHPKHENGIIQDKITQIHKLQMMLL